ncbi:hypothetical protein [uncultured Hymenobacter sp.]|uniref:hypothetical protein n=1 Tax=uncultured Hymenobacter sp. TaxID=170016 RepID=UPI0035CADFBE
MTSNPQQVPATDWVAVVEAYIEVLGRPVLLPEGASIAEATEAKWGPYGSILYLVKDVSGMILTRKGPEELASVSSAEKVSDFVRALTAKGFKVKDKRGFIESSSRGDRTIEIGSVYLSRGPKTLADSVSLGVIHNPDWS